MTMDKMQKDLAKVIESYFGADAAYLDIDVFTLAKRIMEAGYTKPVRCKNCDWYREHEDGICVNPKCGKSWYGCHVQPKHFCSYGECNL